MFGLLALLSGLIKALILRFGYLGVVLAMAVESACIPLPSEIILPFSGFLVALNKLNFWLVSVAGAVGCLLGSSLAWWVGKRFGEEFIREMIRKWGKFIFVFEYELDEAIHWFDKHGEVIIFTSRLLPVVRTFISLPAGIAEMDYFNFAIYTISGSFIWSVVLIFLGFKLGENWEKLGGYFHKFDLVLILACFILGIYYLRHKIKRHHRWQAQKKS